jgi:hypothetical protein
VLEVRHCGEMLAVGSGLDRLIRRFRVSAEMAIGPNVCYIVQGVCVN